MSEGEPRRPFSQGSSGRERQLQAKSHFKRPPPDRRSKRHRGTRSTHGWLRATAQLLASRSMFQRVWSLLHIRGTTQHSRRDTQGPTTDLTSSAVASGRRAGGCRAN